MSEVAVTGYYTMPSLGADMTEGTVLRWMVQPGDRVRRGDVVVLIDTEKAEIEAEIFSDGVVEELLVPEGDTVAVGTPLARLAVAGAAHPAGTAPAEPAVAPPPPAVPPPGVSAPPAVPSPPAVPLPPVHHGPVTLSPLVRHDAERRGIDLAHLHGSGPGGTVRRTDLQQLPGPGPGRRRASSPLARRLAAAAGIDLSDPAGPVGSGPGGALVAADVAAAVRAAGASPVGTNGTEPVAAASTLDRRRARARTVTAELMARAKREIPHYYLSQDVDCRPMLDWLAEANLIRPVTRRLLPAVLLLRATALAAASVPELNGFWEGATFRRGSGVHLGVAVSLRGGGLIAPAIHDADRLDVDQLMAALSDLVRRARRGGLRASELADPTLTVTNLGEGGADAVWGVIYPPQVALVGFGRITERPWAEQGMLTVRPVVTATLSADHRATDGHTGSRFLAHLGRFLTDPGQLTSPAGPVSSQE